MLSVAGEFVAISRVVVEHQQWIAGLQHQRPGSRLELEVQKAKSPAVQIGNDWRYALVRWWNTGLGGATAPAGGLNTGPGTGDHV